MGSLFRVRLRGTNRAGGPSCAMPKPQPALKAYRATVLGKMHFMRENKDLYVEFPTRGAVSE
jgi:hypothetical protein